ncbi:MAG: gamma-glutamylcyclotransferase [Paracoccus sp. (in: a-proteobacteria)]|nr:gamma-glutamylcyclotransferase [Paracoccus sp. (in: a-proteobacteria)]
MRDQNWLFAYGSLMWDPGFDVAERVIATVEGFHRSFCLRSIEYRGTMEFPGLVLGLDETEGASCKGVALRVSDAIWPRVLAEVRARELLTDAYREEILPLLLADGREVSAIAYVMRRDHWQYAGGLCIEEQARIIAWAEGGRGPNRDYLYNTTAHLDALGLSDPELAALAAEVRHLCD